MNVVESLRVLRRGPGSVGTVIFETDGIGVKDASGRYASFAQERSVPLAATSVSTFILSPSEGVWVMESFVESHTVVGGGGCTVMPVVCVGSVAIGSGVAQLTGALSLTVTAPALQFGVMIATPTEMRRGDSLALLFAGTMTGLVGQVTYRLKRIG